MADGLARVTGTPAVCLVTSGPGRRISSRHCLGLRRAFAGGGYCRGPAFGHYYKDAFQNSTYSVCLSQ